VSDTQGAQGSVPAREPPSPLAARIARVETTLGQAVQGLARRQSRGDPARDRSWIARSIIIMFEIATVAVLAILLAQGVMSGDWPKVATEATDLIKSAVLPIVTLVLGYYFGQSDKT